MTWPKRAVCALCALAFGILSTGPATAQIIARPFEVSGGAGAFGFDTRAHASTGPAFGGSLGWRAQPKLTLEGYALFGPSSADTLPEQDHNFSTFGLGLRWNLRPPEGRLVPYLFTGVGYAVSHTTGHAPDKLDQGAPSLGGGLLVNVLGQRTYLRMQALDVFFRDRDRFGFSNHIAVTVGLHHALGGKPRDADADGVRDWLDRCEHTPIGARVDASGCPLDADADSVFDGIDQCDRTPSGCQVDAKGCSIDRDGDGVCDGLDMCADTPAGKAVDAKGCLVDADEDGVKTPDDQCEGTLRGCVVDDRGCPKDGDGDGVCDGLDRCPELGAGFEVDAEGCPVEVLRRERELLDTGRIRMRALSFASDQVALDSLARVALEIAGAVLARWPQLQVEIAGHADAREREGGPLSQARADTVRALLLGTHASLKADSLIAKGYGSDRPATSNETVEGRDRNRRVEFVVLNRGVLIEEVKRRQRMEQLNEGEPK